MWMLRLRGPKGKAATVHLAEDDTLKAFCELAAKELALRRKTNLILRTGFPPQLVTYAPSDTIGTKFQANATIVVDVPAVHTNEPAAPAAPLVAVKVKAKKTRAPATGVHTLSGSSKPRGSAAGKRKARGEGVRLGDASNETATPAASIDLTGSDGEDETPAVRKYRRTKNLQLSSEESIAVNLVEAVGGKSQDRAGKFFRAATKSAVEHQYALTLASARLKAALGKQFEIVENENAQRAGGDGHPAEIRVKFKEGVRKWTEETVQYLEQTELQAILKYVLLSGGETGKEMLKPFNMAQCSTRVFWNIARLYNGDIAAGLAELIPDEDWSYLDTRTRQMSKKAMEAKANEETYQQWKKGGIPATTSVPSTRAKRSSATQDAGNDQTIAVRSQDFDARSRMADQRAMRSAMAKAALARMTPAEEVRKTPLPKPTQAIALPSIEFETLEDDVEKTITVYCDSCNKARILGTVDAKNAGVDAETWTCAQLAAIGRTDGCAAVDDEVAQLAGPKLAFVLRAVQINTRNDLVNASLDPVRLSIGSSPEAAELISTLERIINEARLDEVNDAMAEIIGDSDTVGKLELQKLGTPADLAETPADMIAHALTASGLSISMTAIEDWQEQARTRLQQQPWMGEWRTV